MSTTTRTLTFPRGTSLEAATAMFAQWQFEIALAANTAVITSLVAQGFDEHAITRAVIAYWKEHSIDALRMAVAEFVAISTEHVIDAVSEEPVP